MSREERELADVNHNLKKLSLVSARLKRKMTDGRMNGFTKRQRAFLNCSIINSAAVTHTRSTKNL